MNKKKRFSQYRQYKCNAGYNPYPNIHKKQSVNYRNAMESETVNPVFAGYWFQWNPRINIATMPWYNIFIVAFMDIGENGIPTFKPLFMTDEQFIATVDMLKCQGREALISLGGAGYYIALSKADKQAFINEMIRIIDKYGFTGIDIDLEDDAMTAADNQTVVPEALIELKNYYLKQGKYLMITMAPEFPYLRKPNGPYVPYVQGLEGYYDIIFPQYYNQGADGIWSEELHMWLQNNDNEHKAAFLYELTRAIITGLFWAVGLHGRI